MQQILILLRTSGRCTSTRICSPRPTRPSTGGCRRERCRRHVLHQRGPRANLLAWSTCTARHTCTDGRVRATSAGSPGTTGCCRSSRCSTPTPGACRMPRCWRACRSSCPTVGSRPSRSRASWSPRARPSPEPCRRSGTTCWATSPASSRRHAGGPSSLRLVLCGGSAVPVSLQKALSERHGIEMRQAWGMTETSPVASVAAPAGVDGDRIWRYRGGQGRPARCRGPHHRPPDGMALPHDRESVGEPRSGVRGSPVATPTLTRRGSTTVGCAPVTSGTWTSWLHHPGPTAPRTSSSPG